MSSECALWANRISQSSVEHVAADVSNFECCRSRNQHFVLLLTAQTASQEKNGSY